MSIAESAFFSVVKRVYIYRFLRNTTIHSKTAKFLLCVVFKKYFCVSVSICIYRDSRGHKLTKNYLITDVQS